LQLCEAAHSDKNEICKKEIWSQKLLTRPQENCKNYEASPLDKNEPEGGPEEAASVVAGCCKKENELQ
jgi:hypothetical protein